VLQPRAAAEEPFSDCDCHCCMLLLQLLASWTLLLLFSAVL
jgi:hypothetical protein